MSLPITHLGPIYRYYLRVQAMFSDDREVSKRDYDLALIAEGMNEAMLVWAFSGKTIGGKVVNLNTEVMDVRPSNCVNCGYEIVHVLEQWDDTDPVTGDPIVSDRDCWRHVSSLFPGMVGTIECRISPMWMIARPS